METNNKLDNSWANITEIIPFGYGRIGRRVMKKLNEMFTIPFIIDNNFENLVNDYGIEIISLKKARERIQGKKIVVTTTDLFYNSIKAELNDIGLVENKDYCLFSYFVSEWCMQYKGELYVSKIDTIITSRCTLPCPHCGMYIHRCSNKKDYSLNELCDNFDLTFKTIDYIIEYSLFGGEPLIYKDLPKLISYLMDNYGNRIGRLVLITNGNVNPSNETYECLEKYDVMLSISDYTHRYDYNNVLKKFVEELKTRKIEYSFNRELIWKDLGYPDNPANYTKEDANRHFRDCGHSTFCINEGRLYFCDGMYGAEVNTGFKTDESDVVDIKKMLAEADLISIKKRIIEYIKGEINELGCPSFCRICRGVGEDNNYVIEVGS